jgi:hypothetical protein
MSEVFLLIVVGVVLWAFWAWLGAIFDAIGDYHRKAAADASREDS